MGEKKIQAAPESKAAAPTVAPATPATATLLSGVEFSLADVQTPLLSHPTSARPRAAIFRQMQRQRGNAFVQRAVRLKRESESVSSAAVEHALTDRSTGQALDPRTQLAMEAYLGFNLSNVRIHTDGRSEELAENLNANAFTRGSDIYFAPGSYQPQTRAGQQLLAHELTHAAQQREHEGLSVDQAISHPEDSSEREARAFSENLDKPTKSPLSARPRAALQRDEPVNSQAAPKPAPEPGVLPAKGPINIPPPKPGSDKVMYGDLLLSTDRKFVHWQLEQKIAGEGEAKVDTLVSQFASDIAANKKLVADLEKYGQGDVSGAPLSLDQGTAERIVPVVQEELVSLKKGNAKFLTEFEDTGKKAIFLALDNSATRVEQEASHYGIPKEVIRRSGTTRTTAFPQPRTAYDVTRPQPWTSEHLTQREWAQTASARRGLIAAAKLLQQKRNQIADLQKAEEKSIVRMLLPPAPGIGGSYSYMMAPSELGNRRRAAEEEYAKLRQEKEAEFPILASYAKQGGDLQDLLEAGGGLGNVLGEEMADKLDKIHATEEYIKDGTIALWDVPFIVEGARQKLKLDYGTMQWRIVQDKQAAHAQAKEEAKELKEALGILAFALGILAAIPTGGGSLAVAGAVAEGTSFALGAGIAIADLMEYQVQAAASGSDFDPARAISQENPSLFWLGFELVGAGLGAATALNRFRSLNGLWRQAVAGESAAAKALRAEGNLFKPGVGNRLVAEVEALQKMGSAEVKAAKTAGKLADSEVVQAGKLGEAVVEGVEKHQIIVTKSGVFRCSEPLCANILWLYEDVLKGRSSLRARIIELQQLGESGAKPLAALTRSMDETRRITLLSEEVLQAELKIHPAGTVRGDALRFNQYQRGGGLLEYEEWFAKHQGWSATPPKGQEVWGELAQEVGTIPTTGAVPKGLTPAQTQQLLQEAKAIDTAESVAGGYRAKFGKKYPDFPGGREWQVHHSIPQEFRETLTKAGIDVDNVGFLRGVRTTPGELSNVHAKITTHWVNWRSDFVQKFGRRPTAAEIIEKAKEVDWRFGTLYWEEAKAAGLPVPKANP